jgi:hypothetical protein
MGNLPILYQTTARNGVVMAVRPDATTKSASPVPPKPEEDLEQYGVWIKAEPQDIVEEPEAIQLEASDFDIPSISSFKEEESFLTEDEEKLLGSFETLDEGDESPPRAEGAMENFDSEGSDGIPGIENLPPLEDFEIKDETASDVEDLGASTIDISLDELEASSTEGPSPFRPDANLDISTIRGLDASGSEPEAFESFESPESSMMEDVSAEFLDLEEAPTAPKAETSDVSSEFLDDEPSAPPSPPPAKEEADFEPIDMDLHFDDTLSPEVGHAGNQEPGFEEVSEFDDFFNESAAAKPGAAKGHEDLGFDDLAAVEEDLAKPLTPAPASPRERRSEEQQPQAAEASLSNELLQKIAEELSSIRGELITLKSQIATFKTEEAEPSHIEAAPVPAPAPHAAGGFFDEEEDETIALTGDELDNILNTADFTEENVTESETPPDLDLSADLLAGELILPESGDYSVKTEEVAGMEAFSAAAMAEEEAAEAALGEAMFAEEPLLEEAAPQAAPKSAPKAAPQAPAPEADEGPAIEEIRLEPSTEIEAETELETSDIDLFASEGILPMTQAPEDTSYLEEPLPDEEPLDLAEMPLHEEAILAPEPLSFDIEEMESLDFESEELPVVEPATSSFQDTMSDLTLGMEAAPGWQEGVEEAQALSPLPEIEESSFEEMNLVEEGAEEISEEVEELSLAEEDLTQGFEEEMAQPELAESSKPGAFKPSQPVSMHPDELPMSLDDSYFVGGPAPEEAEEAAEAKAAPKPTAVAPKEVKPAPAPSAQPAAQSAASMSEDDRLKLEIKGVLSYLDKLLESLPEEKIEEFARSEYFDTYKKLFEELGLV